MIPGIGGLGGGLGGCFPISSIFFVINLIIRFSAGNLGYVCGMGTTLEFPGCGLNRPRHERGHSPTIRPAFDASTESAHPLRAHRR